MRYQGKYFLLILALLLIQGNTYVIDAQKNAVWHNTKGLYYMQEQYYYEAATEFKYAILLSNNTSATATFYNNLGIVYEKAGRDDLALQSFQKAIKLNPNFLEYYQNMIKIYKRRKMLPSVIAKYSNSSQKSNANSKTWLVLGLAYLQSGNYDKGVTCLKKFKKLESYSIMMEGVDNILGNFK